MAASPDFYYEFKSSNPEMMWFVITGISCLFIVGTLLIQIEPDTSKFIGSSLIGIGIFAGIGYLGRIKDGDLNFVKVDRGYLSWNDGKGALHAVKIANIDHFFFDTRNEDNIRDIVLVHGARIGLPFVYRLNENKLIATIQRLNPKVEVVRN